MQTFDVSVRMGADEDAPVHEMAGVFEEHAGALSAQDDDLKSVGELALKAKRLEKEIEDLEATLEERKRSHRKMVEEAIPGRLAELGISEFKMADGSKVTVKAFYNASINEANKGAAFEWLRENGFDDIIKNTVSVRFGRNEGGLSDTLVASLRKQGYPVDQNQKIEPQTLKAWAKEMVERGRPFPADLFGLYVGQRASIKSA